mgnify:CR=1 FL=1
MKGSKKVIDALNKQLTAELSAADQYNTHAEMYLDWGLHALYTRMHHEKDEELEHAKRLIERILFLEGVPDTASRSPINIGKTVPEMAGTADPFDRYDGPAELYSVPRCGRTQSARLRL